jgi:hypothetical protein
MAPLWTRCRHYPHTCRRRYKAHPAHSRHLRTHAARTPPARRSAGTPPELLRTPEPPAHHWEDDLSLTPPHSPPRAGSGGQQHHLLDTCAWHCSSVPASPAGPASGAAQQLQQAAAASLAEGVRQRQAALSLEEAQKADVW